MSSSVSMIKWGVNGLVSMMTACGRADSYRKIEPCQDGMELLILLKSLENESFYEKNSIEDEGAGALNRYYFLMLPNFVWENFKDANDFLLIKRTSFLTTGATRWKVDHIKNYKFYRDWFSKKASRPTREWVTYSAEDFAELINCFLRESYLKTFM